MNRMATQSEHVYAINIGGGLHKCHLDANADITRLVIGNTVAWRVAPSRLAPE
jgi:hypothetical protein